MAVSTGRRTPASTGGARRSDLEVAVVGAGPHGLSAAVHLRRAGVSVNVFGSPMSFWRSMPEGMMLRSNMSATNMIEPGGPLSLKSYAAASRRPISAPVTVMDFVDYGTWVQQSAVPDVDERMVAAVERGPGGFTLELDDGGRVSAEKVVIACGIAPFASLPTGFESLPVGCVSHTAAHRDLSFFEGRRVAVVGGGQSAFECAALMAERGAADVEILVRRPSTVWLRGHAVVKRIGRLGPIVYAPTDVGPLWYSRLVAAPELFRLLPRDVQDRIARRCIRPACSHFVRVRLDGVRISTSTGITSATPDGGGLRLTLSDGTTREVDHLMFGTGYRVDVARYPFLGAPILREIERVDGYPVLSRGLESSLAGLHFMGAPAARSIGPIMRFVSGSWHGGQTLAQRLGARPKRWALAGARRG